MDEIPRDGDGVAIIVGFVPDRPYRFFIDVLGRGEGLAPGLTIGHELSDVVGAGDLDRSGFLAEGHLTTLVARGYCLDAVGCDLKDTGGS